MLNELGFSSVVTYFVGSQEEAENLRQRAFDEGAKHVHISKRNIAETQKCRVTCYFPERDKHKAYEGRYWEVVNRSSGAL